MNLDEMQIQSVVEQVVRNLVTEDAAPAVLRRPRVARARATRESSTTSKTPLPLRWKRNAALKP